MQAIAIRGLTHSYKGGKTALRDVDLDIGSGMFGLLGPNGAGKTTLIRILVTLLKPTAGRITIDGLDLQQDRKRIRRETGYLPQEFSSFPRLSAWEFLDYIACLKGIRPRSKRMAIIEKTLEDVGLYEARDRKAGHLSGGMKRRLGIAQTLIGDPKILIVDEPTVGLDPEERVRFRNLLSDLSRQDKTIILSTHIVGDISSTCARIALLDLGKVIFDGTPADLGAAARGKVWRADVSALDLDAVKSKYPVISAVPSERGYEIRVVANRYADGPAESVEPNLEDAYVYFMRVHASRTAASPDPLAPESGRLS
jgi:ABC-2 type transport system ATP-binding protein